MIIDFEELAGSQAYYAMIQTLIPRPVAWVLSENDNGSFNLAPFSFFCGISSNPPLLMFVAGKKPSGELKDTRSNIIERKHFVVHIPSVEQAADVTESSRGIAKGESELDLVNLETTAFGDFALPRIATCPVAYACEVFRIDDVTENQAAIYGQIKQAYIGDELIVPNDKRLVVDAAKLNPLARLGGDDYSGISSPFTVPRPR